MSVQKSITWGELSVIVAIIVAVVTAVVSVGKIEAASAVTNQQLKDFIEQTKQDQIRQDTQISEIKHTQEIAIRNLAVTTALFKILTGKDIPQEQ